MCFQELDKWRDLVIDRQVRWERSYLNWETSHKEYKKRLEKWEKEVRSVLTVRGSLLLEDYFRVVRYGLITSSSQTSNTEIIVLRNSEDQVLSRRHQIQPTSIPYQRESHFQPGPRSPLSILQSRQERLLYKTWLLNPTMASPVSVGTLSMTFSINNASFQELHPTTFVSLVPSYLIVSRPIYQNIWKNLASDLNFSSALPLHPTQRILSNSTLKPTITIFLGTLTSSEG